MREGFKDFGGKIIGGVLLFLAVKYFPILKKLFRQQEEALKQAEAQSTNQPTSVTVKPQNIDGPTGAKEQYELGLKSAIATGSSRFNFDNKVGVRQDYAEAVRLYRLAAEQSHASAQFNLGYMYDEGKGVARDLQKARKWYGKAAAQGDTDAQDALKRLDGR